MFMVFEGVTPFEFYRYILGNFDPNIYKSLWLALPNSWTRTKTGRDYKEGLIYFKTTSVLYPRIVCPKLHLYREGLDPEFSQLDYVDGEDDEKFVRLSGKYIRVWDKQESLRNLKILNDLFLVYRPD